MARRPRSYWQSLRARRDGGADGGAATARPARKKPCQHEKKEQAWGVGLLTTIGAKVYVIGTRRPAGSKCKHCGQFVPNPDQSTRQTPGIPDVLAVLPLRTRSARPPSSPHDEIRAVLWWEAKAPDGGRESEAQAEFRALMAQTATHHVLGSYDDLIAWLLEHGYVKAAGIPHYRLPKHLQERA